MATSTLLNSHATVNTANTEAMMVIGFLKMALKG